MINMNILGIYEGHSSGAALITNKEIRAVISEERLSRIKMHDGRIHGFPFRSIKNVLKICKLTPEDIDIIAIAIEPPLNLMLDCWSDLLRTRNFTWIFYFLQKLQGTKGPLNYFSPYYHQSKRMRYIKKSLAELGFSPGTHKIYVDHHMAHAASAYFTSAKDHCLIVTLDGKGDGLSGSVYLGEDGNITRLKRIPHYHSLGYFYSSITVMLGFKQSRHEGKITGLAAYGTPDSAAYNVLKDTVSYNLKDGGIKFHLSEKIPFPLYPLFYSYPFVLQYKKMLQNFKREDVAAAAQRRLEEVVHEFIQHWVNSTKVFDVVAAGGIFANVKLNQKVLEMPEVNSLFIHPAMGDDGLALGAALYALSSVEPLDPVKLTHVYFGPEYDDVEIENALGEDNIQYEKVNNIEKYIGSLLSEGKVIGRFDGRMEYGPRALGNRSILYKPTDPSVNDWLNKRLNRTEFMPFAPSILEEYASELYIKYDKGKYPAKFMTITFDVTKEGKKLAPAVVHVDGTARPQVVSNENPSYQKIIRAFYEETGLPIIINTSFNMHEEPIVCSPKDAINAFKRGSVDVLAIGNYIADISTLSKR